MLPRSPRSASPRSRRFEAPGGALLLPAGRGERPPARGERACLSHIAARGESTDLIVAPGGALLLPAGRGDSGRESLSLPADSVTKQ